MATHIVVNPDIVAGSGDRAFLQVSGEPASTVTYTIFSPAAPPQTVNVTMTNGINFATSPELFALTAGRSAIIVAATANQASPSVAVLRQEAGTLRDSVTIPSSNLMLGTSFNLPIGPQAGDLYIANAVSSSDAAVVVQYGNSTSPGVDQTRIPGQRIAKIRITRTNINLMVTVTNGVPVVVFAVLDREMLAVFPIGPGV